MEVVLHTFKYSPVEKKKTNSMSPSREANSHSICQDIPHLLWNPNIHDHDHKDLPIPRAYVTCLNKLFFYAEELLASLPNPQAEGKNSKIVQTFNHLNALSSLFHFFVTLTSEASEHYFQITSKGFSLTKPVLTTESFKLLAMPLNYYAAT
jgi:hypothetical protein